VIDDESTPAPTNLLNIPDIQPVGGMRYQFSLGTISATSVLTSSYFKYCNRFSVRRALATPSTIPTYQLPYWVRFHESNSSFTIYPDKASTAVSIEVRCCNDIEQCATNTFAVTPQNTAPTSLIGSTNEQYVLQLDGTVGQAFSWGLTDDDFVKGNTAPTLGQSQYDSTYAATNLNNEDHTVMLSYTTPLLSQFSQVSDTGLLYGQASTSNYLASVTLQNLPYTFYDLYTSSQPGKIQVLVNRMPQVTGTAYTFSLVDPSIYETNDFFNKYFPFLADRAGIPLVTVQTSTWFSSSQSLTYNMNMSDNTQAPSCFLFDPVTGEFTIDPTLGQPSELVNLKFEVSDPHQGWARLYKQILINSSPKAVRMFTLLKLGVRNKFKFDLAALFVDYDGDSLTLTIPNAADLVSLAKHGIEFRDATKSLWGKLILVGTVSLLTVQATDPHGYSAKAYITIVIQNYEVMRRRKGDLDGRFPDVSIYEKRRFTFRLNDTLFYTNLGPNTLIFFASD